MSCLSTTRRTQLQTRLAQKEIQLTSAYDAFNELVGESILSYRFDSGEGSQQVRRKDAQGMLNMITSLETYIDWLTQKLNGQGISNMNLRRKYGARVY